MATITDGWAGAGETTQAPPRPRVASPRPAHRMLMVVAIGVFLLGAGMALIGGSQVGVSTDEPVHQSRMNTWFETGWYVPKRFFDGDGQRKSTVTAGRWHSYGAGYSLTAHTVAVLAGSEQWGTTNRSPRAHAARGVTVAGLGIAAAAAVGFATAVATASRLAGAWAAAATLAIPVWTGYSMFAVKDVPAAAGWTFVTAALAVALFRAPGRARRLGLAAMCAAGVWFSVGVRTALWVPLLAAVIVFAVLAAARWRTARGNVVAVAGGLAAGLAAVAATHHRNAATPVEWFLSAVRTSSDFHWSGKTLTLGQLVSQKPPFWYLPAWVSGSLPLLLGLLAGIGAVAAVVGLLRRGPGPAVRGRLRTGSAVMALWGVQALLLPAAATLGDATMYAGLRHHLYVLPAVAALAGFAAAGLLRTWGGRWLVPAALAAALVVPAAEQVPLYPYQFVYKNPLAGPVNDRWETDMHFVSGREALARVPAGTTAWCSVKVGAPLRIRTCAGQRQVRAFTAEQGRDAADGPDPATVWVVGRKYRGNPPPPECTEDHHVTRWLRGEPVILAYLLRCPPAVLPAEAP